MEIPEGWDSAGTTATVQEHGQPHSIEHRPESVEYMHGQGNMRVLLLLYVDDMSIAYPSTAATTAGETKRRLAEKYKATNLGTARQLPGIEIETCKEISLGQKACPETVRHGKCARSSHANGYGHQA